MSGSPTPSARSPGGSPNKILIWPTKFEDKCEQLTFKANTDPRLPPAFSKSDEQRLTAMTKEFAEKRRAALLEKERKAEKEIEAEKAAAKTEWKQRQKVRHKHPASYNIDVEPFSHATHPISLLLSRAPQRPPARYPTRSPTRSLMRVTCRATADVPCRTERPPRRGRRISRSRQSQPASSSVSATRSAPLHPAPPHHCTSSRA